MAISASLKKTLFAAGVIVWLGAAAWGSKLLAEYSFQQSEAGTAVDAWPADAGFSRADGIPTIVVAIHPECPCSRATLEELDSLLAQTSPSLRAIAVFLDDNPNEPAGNSDLFKFAQKMPGVSLVRDRDGSELRRFGFKVSGETRLYRADGALAFRGGITGSRGHLGDNPGRQGALMTTRGPQDGARSAVIVRPVFGCELFDAPTHS